MAGDFGVPKGDSSRDYVTISVITKDEGIGVATYQIMYWQDIPSQIKARDENGIVKKMLPSRFQEAIDSAAVAAGKAEADAYLDGWQWGGKQHRPGDSLS